MHICGNDFNELIREKRIILENSFSNLSSIEKDNVLGLIQLESLSTPKYEVVNSRNIFYKNVNLSRFLRENTFGMQFHFGSTYEFKYRKQKFIAQDNTNLFGLAIPEQDDIASFSENKRFDDFGIFITEKTMKNLACEYPDLLGDIMCHYEKGESYIIKNNYQPTTMEMIHVISQIKNAKLLGNTSDMYIEAKVLELLWLKLQKDEVLFQKDIYKNDCKTISEIEKIHEAKSLLVANLNQSPTISELSKTVGLNECKLKYGFKKVYNQTVFGYLFDYKMNLAHKLLLDTNNTITEIAFDCGYGQASHFITAFKRKFGVTPKEFRRRA